MHLKSKLLLSIGVFFLPAITVFGQFVEAPTIAEPANSLAIKSNIQTTIIFDALILVSALIFIISLFGFVIGLIKLITSGGDEITAETATNMLVLSGWIFGASVLGYLLINMVKYFIY